VVADSLKVLDPKRPIREEKHEPASHIDTVVAGSLKVLDPKRPIREADLTRSGFGFRLTSRDCRKSIKLCELATVKFRLASPSRTDSEKCRKLGLF
jgi:hypothetical protein